MNLGDLRVGLNHHLGDIGLLCVATGVLLCLYAWPGWRRVSGRLFAASLPPGLVHAVLVRALSEALLDAHPAHSAEGLKAGDVLRHWAPKPREAPPTRRHNPAPAREPAERFPEAV